MSKLTPGSEFYLTYDDYYGNQDTVGQTSSIGFGSILDKDDKISFEAFVSQNASKNMFDNDLLEMQYKFWETPEERETRLKQTWLDLQKRNALGGVDSVSSEE